MQPFSNPDTTNDTALLYPSLETCLGTLSLRDCREEDAEHYAFYWSQKSVEKLKMLGVDYPRLGNHQQLRDKFLSLVPRGDIRSQKNAIFSICLNGLLVGYTNTNRHSDRENYCHIHFYEAGLRTFLRAYVANTRHEDWTDPNIGAILMGIGIAHNLELFGMSRVIAQTRVTNRLVNEAVDQYGPPDETLDLEKPDGLSKAGRFHHRFFYYEKRHEYNERGRELARLTALPAKSAIR